MSTFPNEKLDTDLKHFVEEYGEDVYNAILKMIDGVHDEDVERIKEDYGVEDFNKLERLIAGKLEGEELRLFIDEYEEFYNDFQKLFNKKVASRDSLPGAPYKKGDFIGQKYSDMSNYSKEHWDEDIKCFAEEWGETLCKAILKIKDGVPDGDFADFKEEYGEELFDKMKKLVEGNLVGRELKLFIEENNEFHTDFKEIAKKKGWLRKGKKLPGTPYRKGDFIDEDELYEIYDVLGMGGFGIVYLVYSCGYLFALKTFRDEYMEDVQTRERFKKEAQTWIELERHPYIVTARSVEILSGRPYIEADYIAPNEEGLNTLDGYLKHRPPDLAQSLRWGIQFCHGMEYAYSKGIRAHRDIKPANIMIGYNKIDKILKEKNILKQDNVLKITDFGIAGVIGSARISGIKLGFRNDTIGLSCQTMEGSGFGTPTHMPPEQFINAVECDERSDIYSFGIVLYQMATGGNLPFIPKLPQNEQEHRRFWQDIYRLHCQAPVPKLNSPLFPIIQRCLEKSPNRRYRSFQELRADIEPILKGLTGEVVEVPRYPGFRSSKKAESLKNLGKHHEAIACYDKMIEMKPTDSFAWAMKGICLAELGKYQEALACYDREIELSMTDSFQHSSAWSSKGDTLFKMGKYEEAIDCYDKALEIRPRDTDALIIKGRCLGELGKHAEAIACYDKALEINPKNSPAWSNKGTALCWLGMYQEAIEAYENFIKFAPAHYADQVTKANLIIEKLKAKLSKKSVWKRLFG